MTAQTSLWAFEELVQSPSYSEMQALVMQGLKTHGPCTDRELERELPGLRENVRKRRAELARLVHNGKPLIRNCGTKTCSVTGRTSQAWDVWRENI